MYISIHALVKRATKHHVKKSRCYLHFNPRPREEGDPYGCVMCVFNAISIHALVKRATAIICVPRRSRVISIHALVKRATRQ